MAKQTTRGLVIPARINQDEARDCIRRLRETADDLEAAMILAEEDPKEFMSVFVGRLTALDMEVRERITKYVRQWIRLGGDKNRIARQAKMSYATVHRRYKEMVEEDMIVAEHTADDQDGTADTRDAYTSAVTAKTTGDPSPNKPPKRSKPSGLRPASDY